MARAELEAVKASIPIRASRVTIDAIERARVNLGARVPESKLGIGATAMILAIRTFSFDRTSWM